MDTEDMEQTPETRRTTRSGRAIRTPETKKTSGRKTRKKVVMIEVEVSDEDFEKDGGREKKELNQVMETESVQLDASDNAVEAPEMESNKTNQVIEEAMEINEDQPILNQIVFDDSNSMINDFNSFKGAESSSDAINNESNSCFDVIQESTENAQDIPLQNENSEMNEIKDEVNNSEQGIENLIYLPEDIPDIPEENNVNQSENSSDSKEETAENETKPNQVLSSVDPDAENISEDELPTVQAVKVPETEEVSDEELPKLNDGIKVEAVKVPETEEVSDDELPGPKRAELPADTEVVSEDELESVKKESNKRKLDEDGYDPGSPTSENETAPKKPALEKSEEVVDVKEKPKKLPELDKYWKAVNDDPTDFTGWTYLLQYVDQENDMEAAREAYDAFLSHYPYCYGYWRKYADYEKRKGNKKKCEEVFERGLKAIPLSVDLWIHYLMYIRTSKADDEEFVRSQFERSLDSCGLEFRSDRLWENYIKWETEGKRLLNATHVYERLLSTPTQGYLQHFDNFQEHVQTNAPNKVLEVDEFTALRKEVKTLLKQEVADLADNPDIPPGADSEENTDEETKAIKDRIISIRRKLHKNTSNLVTERWNFEEGIKRPYFHVKPLERCQLKNWQDYLEFEISQGDKTRIIVLFERCLVACALYEDFWLKYVHYLQGLEEEVLTQKIKDVYERACTIHHLKKPNIHLQWAMFEESIKNYNKSAEILQNLEKSVPNLLQIAYRRINLERRRGDHEKCCQLFEHYITNTKNKLISTNLAIKYSRFTLQLLNNVDKALEIINSAIIKDPNNSRLYLQLIDITLHRDTLSEEEIIKHIDAFLEREHADIDQKILFSQRKLEFLEDFGAEIISVQRAYNEYQKYVKASKESGKKKDSKQDSTKKDKNQTTTSSNSYNNYGGYGNSTAGSYQYGNSQQGTYNQYQQYGQSGEQYQYGNWPYQGNYSGYNQWGGYGSGYSY